MISQARLCIKLFKRVPRDRLGLKQNIKVINSWSRKLADHDLYSIARFRLKVQSNDCNILKWVFVWFIPLAKLLNKRKHIIFKYRMSVRFRDFSIWFLFLSSKEIDDPKLLALPTRSACSHSIGFMASI